MVEFVDGSTLAQASPPDMRIPIALALGWPDRVPDAAPACDWSSPVAWEFFPLDDEAFPAVRLARQAAQSGGTAPAVYNAANEVAVAEFLGGRLPFPSIVDTVAATLDAHEVGNVTTLDDVEQADAWARGVAAQVAGAGTANAGTAGAGE
jgi:1-deoxy-D-xylulose-5-phosphate reductoisomerase